MRDESADHNQPIFNNIRIDLRANALNNYQYTKDNDHRSQSLAASRISRYSEYPQIRATNPLYSVSSTERAPSSYVPTSTSRSSATLVNRRQKFDPQAPRRPNDWRWLAILCIILFFPIGGFAFAFAYKAQKKFRSGFIAQSHALNRRALILCIISILAGIALIVGLLFGFDAWPRTNG